MTAIVMRTLLLLGMLLSASVLPVGDELLRLAAPASIVAVALWLAASVPMRRARCALALLAITALFLPRLPVPIVPVAAALLVALIELVPPGRLLPAGTSLAIMSFALVRLASSVAPQLERFLGDRLQQLAQVGMTAGGAWGCLLAILTAACAGCGRARATSVLVALLLSMIGIALVAHAVPAHTATPFLPGTMLAFAMVVLAGVAAPSTRTLPPAHHRRSAPVAGLCVIAIAAGAWCSRPWSPIAAAPPRVLVVNHGGLDWERPRFGKFGQFDGGMFGLLPLYLGTIGCRVHVTDAPCPTDAELEAHDVVVLVNNPKHWSDAERQHLIEFVRGGKSLLVLGDHTNVFGLQAGFDTLLGPLGIAFRFDSAYHLRAAWQGCLAAHHALFTQAIATRTLGHAIGASLVTKGAAAPLVTARFGFSDRGEPDNEMGSYLGNYRYDAGELLGDVTLVAMRTLGRGKVVVYGDTSAFQNSQLPKTFLEHVAPLFLWLGRPATWRERGSLLIGALALLAALALITWHRRLPAGALLAGLGICGALAGPRPEPVPLADTRDVVWIDQTLLERTGHYDAGRNAIFPLFSNLERAGLLPLENTRIALEHLPRGRAIALIAPSRAPDDRALHALWRYAQDGGVVLVAASSPDAAEVAPLLQRAGLALEPLPLGNFPPARGDDPDQTQPRLLDAWPIIAVPAADPAVGAFEPLLTQGGHTPIGWRPIGAGGLLLIGDTRFFAAQNMEDDAWVWEGNAVLFYHLAKRFLKVDPDVIATVFASPPKS